MLAPERGYARDGEKPDVIVLIEYSLTKHGWKPSSVISQSENGSPAYYDFDWCEHDQELCCHCSGGGGGGSDHELGEMVDAKVRIKLWHDPERINLTHGGKPVTSAEARKLGYQILDAPLDGNPFDGASEESEVVYCIQCKDHYNTEHTCRHLYYQEGAGWGYLGCGASEAGFAESQRSLFLLLDVLPPDAVAAMKHALMRGKFSCAPISEFDGGDTEIILAGKFRSYRRFGLRIEELGREIEAEDRYWPGLAWLMSITPHTREAWALTLGWFYQWEREYWNSHCVLSNATFIRRLPSAELGDWLAIDPHDVSVLKERSLVVNIPFKVTCANDAQFLEHPERTHGVILWPKDPGTDRRSLKLTVAKVKLISKKQIGIWFGRVLEHNGKHVSELEGYKLVS